MNNNNDKFEIMGKDLNKMIAIGSYFLKINPYMNNALVKWLIRLSSLKKISGNDSNESNDSNKVNDLNKSNELNESIGLDEMIFNLGMSLPSWKTNSNDSNEKGIDEEN